MAVTPLAQLQVVRLLFEIKPSDLSQDAILVQYIAEASRAITDWCNLRDFGVRQYTAFPRGWNTPSIWVQDLPLQGQIYTGNLTFGSTTVTGMSSTANLFPLQTALQGQFLTPGTYVASIVDSATITLSQPALTSGTSVPIAFGIALFEDDSAYGGSVAGSFGLPIEEQGGSLLVEGEDYWIDYEQGPGTTCLSGLINFIGGYWFNPAAYGNWTITPLPGPAVGNLKAIYNAGYPQIPPSVTAACELLVAIMRRVGPFGKENTSLSDGMLSVALAAAGKIGLLDPSVTRMLAPYQRVMIG
jgi:hypothetical protein